MATVVSITTSLRARTAEFDAAMSRAGKTVSQFQMRSQSAHAALSQLARAEIAANVDKQANSFRALNDSLKGVLGRGSAFKDMMEIAMGGGAVAGLSMVTRAIGNMGTALSEMAAQSLKAGANMDEMASKFVSSIPVIGGVHDALKGVHDFIDVMASGQNAAINAGARAEQNKKRSEGLAGAAQAAAEQQANAQNRRFMIGKSGADAIRGNAAVRNDVVERELQKRQDEMIAQHGKGITATDEFRGLRIAAEAEKAANNAEANAEIAELAEKSNKAIWEGIGNAVTKQIETVEKSLGRVGGALAGGIGAVTGAIGARMEQGAERRQRAADREAKEAAARRRSFIGSASSIYERLKEHENAPMQFGRAAVVGSQDEFAMRQRSLFGGQVAKADTTQLMREAVAEAKKQLDEQKRTNDLLGQIADEEGVDI